MLRGERTILDEKLVAGDVELEEAPKGCKKRKRWTSNKNTVLGKSKYSKKSVSSDDPYHDCVLKVFGLALYEIQSM